MSTKYITNRIAIDTSTAEEVYSNGETGDAKVTLCKAWKKDASGTDLNDIVYYLETNGDPVLVTEGNEYECAEALGFDDVRPLRELY